MNHLEPILHTINKPHNYEELNPDVWFPHIWFFLRTMAHSYPDNPTVITKRKFYDTIQNFPIFLPHNRASNEFSYLLDVYPVSPYLGNKNDLMLWVHFMENMINKRLGKTTPNKIDYTAIQHKELYYNEFKPKILIKTKCFNINKTHLLSLIIIVLTISSVVLLR